MNQTDLCERLQDQTELNKGQEAMLKDVKRIQPKAELYQRVVYVEPPLYFPLKERD